MKCNKEYIPSQYQDMVEFLGTDKFIDFCGYFGGSNIYVPSLKTIETHSRNSEIISLFQGGCGVKELAKKYNLSVNAIRSIVKNPQL